MSLKGQVKMWLSKRGSEREVGVGPKVCDGGHQISEAPTTPLPCHHPRSTPSLAPSASLSSALLLSIIPRLTEEILLLPAPKHIRDSTLSAPSHPPGLVFNQMSPSQGPPLTALLTMYCPHPSQQQFPSTALFPGFYFLPLWPSKIHIS